MSQTSDTLIHQAGIGDCKAVSTPTCTDAEYYAKDATDYRSIAARLNFLAQDRVDVQYVAEDIAKHMARPMAFDLITIQRVARYLLGTPRYVQRYEWQQQETRIDAYADSEWAGTVSTEKARAEAR